MRTLVLDGATCSLGDRRRDEGWCGDVTVPIPFGLTGRTSRGHAAPVGGRRRGLLPQRPPAALWPLDPPAEELVLCIVNTHRRPGRASRAATSSPTARRLSTSLAGGDDRPLSSSVVEDDRVVAVRLDYARRGATSRATAGASASSASGRAAGAASSRDRRKASARSSSRSRDRLMLGEVLEVFVLHITAETVAAPPPNHRRRRAGSVAVGQRDRREKPSASRACATSTPHEGVDALAFLGGAAVKRNGRPRLVC